MERIVSQQLYDDVVRENIEEFSMSPIDAITDAIMQFEAQGVDLSHIVKDLILTKDNFAAAKLEQIRTAIESKDYHGMTIHLDKLKAELDKDSARRIYAANNGAYGLLVKLMKDCKSNTAVLRSALKVMTCLMTSCAEILDDEGIALQMELLDEVNDVRTLQCLLQWIRECCIKHEVNRQRIFNAEVFPRLKKILVREEATGSELRDACAVIRALVLDDDMRHEYGKGQEYARLIAREALGVITSLMPRFRKDKSVVGDFMITLAALAVRSEFCQEIDNAGGLKFIIDVMTDFPDSEKLNWQALKLLKVLAGDDDVKSQIMIAGCGPLIVSVMSRMKTSECVVTAALACISALTLRCPWNAGVFYDCNAAQIIVDAMKAYPENIKLQQQAAWAIRNMCVRNKAECKEFVTYGVEEVLTNALKRHGASIESDVKAAQRDLGIKVDLKEEWTGKGVNMSNGTK